MFVNGALRFKFLLILLGSLCLNSAAAQVVLIPHGDYENDFEKYLVVIVSFELLCFAAWRFYKNGR